MPTVGLALLVVVVLALLVGGILDVGRASAPYRRDVNRSYVAQASELALQSNATGAELRTLMASMTTLDRDSVGHQLEALAATSAQVAQESAALTPPDPSVDGFEQVMAERAQAVREVQGAVDGVLGLSGGTIGTGVAASRIAGAGSLLRQADREYAQVRRQFLVAPGNARLPRSTWVLDPSGWSAAPVTSLVQALTLTPSLAPVHRMVVVPGTVHIVPAAVPPVHPGGPSVVLPTTSLQVSAVVANQGNVDERGVRATASVTPQGPGRSDLRSVAVSIGAGGSADVTFPQLAVAPGDTYTLDVSVDPPPGQTVRSEASYTVRIAPPTPATTTTTTTTTTTSPKKVG